ncbi:MAG: hypothetical protein J0H49_37010 [Acidobacteria bacterium]|nr:hypothetical protein [Acidobacteriota bacterium]
MREGLLLFLLAAFASAQTPASPRPFKPTAQLGVPYVIGAESTVIGSKEKIEVSSEREVTLDSAELSLRFPNLEENVFARGGEKLLILRGSIRNHEKTTTARLTSKESIGLRLWQAYKGPGKFKFVGAFDQASQKYISKQLKPGDSGQFVAVWRIPADLTDFDLGLMYDTPRKIAWYALAPVMGRIRSTFAAPDGVGATDLAKVGQGETFDLGPLEIRMEGVSDPETVGGTRRPEGSHRYVVNLTVVNRLLLPARWGWQYVTSELLTTEGTVVKAYPDIIDSATDRPWYGDLNPGASVTARFLFPSATAVSPRALRLTLPDAGRTVEVAIQR